MMDEYRGLAVFVAVVDAGSFSAAGRRLKLSTSVVSHHISRLEERLGVSVFYRSTRSLSLTSEGKKILPSAKDMVGSAEKAIDLLTESSDLPVGSLKITLPTFGNRSAVNRAIWRFADENPMVAFSVHSSDSQIDIVKEGIDVAIRLGTLADSSLKSRRIGSFERLLVASPTYLSRCNEIKTIDDLRNCSFISISMLSDSITLIKGKEQVTFVPDNIRLDVNSIDAAKSAILEGLGIQHIPKIEVERELKSGELQEVLPNWSLPILGVYAVWPDNGPQKKLTRLLIDYLVDQKM